MSHEWGDCPGHPNEFFCERSQRMFAEGLAVRVDTNKGENENEESISEALC